MGSIANMKRFVESNSKLIRCERKNYTHYRLQKWCYIIFIFITMLTSSSPEKDHLLWPGLLNVPMEKGPLLIQLHHLHPLFLKPHPITRQISLHHPHLSIPHANSFQVHFHSPLLRIPRSLQIPQSSNVLSKASSIPVRLFTTHMKN